MERVNIPLAAVVVGVISFVIAPFLPAWGLIVWAGFCWFLGMYLMKFNIRMIERSERHGEEES